MLVGQIRVLVEQVGRRPEQIRAPASRVGKPPRFLSSRRRATRPAMALSLEQRARWLSSPLLIAAVKRAVAQCLPRQEVDDATQNALTEGWVAKDPPEEENAFLHWLLKVAYNKTQDHWREVHRDQVFPMSPEQFDKIAGLVARDEHDKRAKEGKLRVGMKAVEEATAQDPTLADGVDAMLDQAEGKSLAESAKERGISEGLMRQRALRARIALKPILFTAIGSTLVAVLATAAVMQRNIVNDWVAAGRDAGTSGAPDVFETAQHTRELAREYCGLEFWGSCLDFLDRANKLDRQNDPTAESRALRAKATVEMERVLEERRRQRELEAGSLDA